MHCSLPFLHFCNILMEIVGLMIFSCRFVVVDVADNDVICGGWKLSLLLM